MSVSIWRLTILFGLLLTGCASDPQLARRSPSVDRGRGPSEVAAPTSAIRLAAHDSADETSNVVVPAAGQFESLADLELTAQRHNPTLRRLCQEYQAARAKSRYINKLPDPTIGTLVFGHPIETAAGSQRANLTVSQMLPWLARLDAQSQQACLEAMSLGRVYAAQRLKTIADLRALWYRRYVLGKHIEINVANQKLLESLIDVANARVATGDASQSDVLIGTLEYSKLEEQLIGLRRQLSSTQSAINRLLGRDAATPVEVPRYLNAALPAWDHPMLVELARRNQPEIEAARIRTQASRWGVEVARLQRRPNFTVNASWFAIDDNRPSSTIVDVGQDAWAVGAMMSVPLRREKYDAMEQESLWKHAATHSSIQEVTQRYDAALFELWEQARAADQTARLYQTTIIPQAKRTLTTDQEAYSNDQVEFDRVIRDVQNLLTLELGYHRSIGQLATAIARIKQSAGTELFVDKSPVVDEGSSPPALMLPP